MQLKIFLTFAFIGFAAAQRGHYAGANRPILGNRYQNQASPQANSVSPSQQTFDNRFGGGQQSNNFQQQPGSGFVNPGFAGPADFQGFPVGFYGRR